MFWKKSGSHPFSSNSSATAVRWICTDLTYEFPPTSSASSSPSSASSSWWLSQPCTAKLGTQHISPTSQELYGALEIWKVSTSIATKKQHQTTSSLSPYQTSGISCIIITAVPFSGANSPKSGTSSSTLAAVGRCYWAKPLEATEYHIHVIIHLQHITTTSSYTSINALVICW